MKLSNQLLDLRQNALHDHADAGSIGVQAVALQQVQIAGDTIEKERIEQRFVFGGKRGIDAFERRYVISAEIRSSPHAAQQDSNVTRRQPLQNHVERCPRQLRLEAAQHVIGTKFDDHRIGAVRHRPIEPGKAVRGRIAGDTGIRDLDGGPSRGERSLQPLDETIFERHTKSGRKRIAECDNMERLLRRDLLRHDLLGHGRRAIAATTSMRQLTAIWRKRRSAPYVVPGQHESSGLVTGMNDISGHPSADDAIVLRGVNLSLGRGAAHVHILRDINVNIGRGEAVGMLGPSGSGKSTLLMVMTGLEPPDSGSVQVAGEELPGLDEDRLARFRGRNIGIVFQAFHLIPTMTALENVAVPLELAGAADALARAERELAAVGPKQRLHHYPAQLSGGEQQRVALARAPGPIRRYSSPTSRPAISTNRRDATLSSYCSAAMWSGAQRWFWSRTIPRSRRVASVCCISARDRLNG